VPAAIVYWERAENDLPDVIEDGRNENTASWHRPFRMRCSGVPERLLEDGRQRMEDEKSRDRGEKVRAAFLPHRVAR
jgi:hypothetical protein